MSLVGPIFGTLSVILLLASSPSYILSTIRGKMKPQRATWFIWSVLGLTALTSQLALGASWSLVFIAADSLGNVAMLLLALRYGVGGWSRLDRVALGVSAIGIIVSIVAREPIIALVGVILADGSGAALTIRKAYLDPDSEDPLAWTLIGFSAIAGLIAVGRYDLLLWLYPAYIAVANFGVVAGQRFGRVRGSAKS